MSVSSHRGVSPDQPCVSVLLYQTGEALLLQLALFVEGEVAQPALLGALRQRVVAVGGHDVPGLQELDCNNNVRAENCCLSVLTRPVLLVIGKALYDAGQVLVGVLAALHSRGAKDWTIAGFVWPVLKWSVQSGTSNGPLAILLAAGFTLNMESMRDLYLVVKFQYAPISHGKANWLFQPELCLNCASLGSEEL